MLNQSGQQIRQVADVVARWDSNQSYPPVTGLIVRVGRRRARLPIDAVAEFGRDRIRLRTARLDLREVAARSSSAGPGALIPGNLIQLLVEAQILNGIITPILLTYMLILANRTSVLGAAANGRAFRIVATISAVTVAILSVIVLVQSVLSAL